MQVANSYQQGDIIDVDLGLPPTEVQGHEQGKKRPCVVVKAFSPLQLAIVIPCTSQQFVNYTVVKLRQGSGGLNSESYALCHQIRTVSFQRIKKVIGRLHEIDMEKIKAVLADTLDL